MKKSLLSFVAFLTLFCWQGYAQITSYPYLEDFESGAGGWTINAGGSWALGTPAGAIINSAASGTQAFATNLTGNYNTNETGSVQSPVFDFTSLTNPGISLSVWWNAEFSWDGLVLQSSIDGGTSWQNVGAVGDPVNWFTDGTIGGNPGGQQEGWTGRNATANGSGGWVTASHLLNGLGGQPNVLIRLAFGSDGSVVDEGVAFDDISISNINCPQPSALTATAITATSADLGWTENGTAMLWDIELGTAGFTPTGTPTTTGSPNNPTNVTGLSGSTQYDFYVRSDCGGSQSAWTGPFTFLTACTVTATPWSDDVESHAGGVITTSNCWNVTANAPSYNWTTTTSGTTPSLGTGANSANSGNNYFFTEASGAGVGNIATLETPDLDFSGVTVPQLNFYYHMFGGQIGDLNVEITNDAGATWTTVTTISGAQQGAQADPWLLSETTLAAYAGQTVRLRFRAVANGTFEGDICIDDIAIVEAPSCPNPSNLMVTGSTANSATFAWTPGNVEPEWALEYGAPGFAPGTGAGTSVVTSNNPETITGLTPDSFYEIYVRAICAPGDTSAYVGPIAFNTFGQGVYMVSDNDCGPGFTDISATGTPTNLTDDASVNITLPFTLLYQGTPYTDVSITENGAVLFGTGLNVGFGNGPLGGAADGIYGFWDDLQPDFGNTYYETVGTAPNQQFIVQFDMKNYWLAVDGQDITFQVIIDEATQEIYTIYQDVEFGGTQAFADLGGSATIGAAGPNQDIEVSFNNTSYLTDNSCIHYFYTDCPDPVNFQLTSVTINSAGFTWDAGLAGETNWTIIYGPAGFDPATGGTPITSTTNSAIIPGLDDITTYDVYIFADCNPGTLQSMNGLMGTFTTLPNCSDPTTLAGSSAVDSIFTSWNWVESSGSGTYPSTGFNVQYGFQGFPVGSGTVTNADNNFTDTTFNTALIGGGVYHVYVQALCGSDTSNYVGPITITMPLSNDEPCDAEALLVDGSTYILDNTGATVAANENTIAPPATGFNTTDGWSNSTLDATTWFTFVAPASGNMWISGTEVNYDGQIAIYDATTCSDFGTFTLTAANDDAVDQSSAAPMLSLCGLTPGNTYYIMHDAQNVTGQYAITLTEISIEAGSTSGIIDVCTGDTANLFTGISGNDAGGIWEELIPTANFADSLFPSAGLAYQVFEFRYIVTEGCAMDTVMQEVQIYGPSSAGNDGTLTVCQNQPFSLTDGLSGTVDLGGTWYDPQNNPLSGPNITASSIAGNFNYDYITGNGVCPDDTANIVVTVDANCDFLNIEDIAFGNMSVYPNPSAGIVFVENFGSSEVFNYEVTDLKGRIVAEKDAVIDGDSTTEINLEGMDAGVYLIKVFNGDVSNTYRVVLK